jgi:hypothetical protein
MCNVEREGVDFFYRRVCRWYSKSFHTPLHEVEQLPWKNILLAYFEERFYEMYNSPSEEVLQQYEQQREMLTMTEDELVEYFEAERDEEQQLANWEQELIEQVQKQDEAKKQAQQDQLLNTDLPGLADIPESFSLDGIDDIDGNDL